MAMINSKCVHAPKTDTPATQASVKSTRRKANSVRQSEEYFTQKVTCDYCHLPGVRMSDNYYHRTDDEREACGRAFNATLTLESTLAAERASRLQAETQAFNAGILKGWNDAVSAAIAIATTTGPFTTIRELRRLSKPSVSPEQAEEK